MLPIGSWASQINYQLRQYLEKDMQTSQLKYSWEVQTLSQVNLGCVKLTIKKSRKIILQVKYHWVHTELYFFKYMLEVFVFNLIRSSFSVHGVCVCLWALGCCDM